MIPPLENSDFVAHMELVLDVYKTPYDEEFPVVCMDESPKQLIKQTRIPIARKPGRDAREDYEYERKGVVNISMANEPLKDKRYIKVLPGKTKKDWSEFSVPVWTTAT